jgi:hypothetical protein
MVARLLVVVVFFYLGGFWAWDGYRYDLLFLILKLLLTEIHNLPERDIIKVTGQFERP